MILLKHFVQNRHDRGCGFFEWVDGPENLDQVLALKKDVQEMLVKIEKKDCEIRRLRGWLNFVCCVVIILIVICYNLSG